MPILAPNLSFEWLAHGFGERDSVVPAQLTTVKQIHSAIVVDAEGRQGVNCGEGDALVAHQAGLMIGVKTADCVPLLIADERTRAVAAVHAGWRGSAAGIVQLTVRFMEAEYGSRPRDLHAAIGPAIGGCCYEVSPEVAHQFREWIPELAEVTSAFRIDLTRVNQIQLSETGVESIWTAGLCTQCLPDRFWSFRREKEQAGRMMSWIGQISGS